MREVPGAYDFDALESGPPIQMFRIEVPARGAGEAGMDVEIGDE